MIEEKKELEKLKEDVALLEDYAEDLFSFIPLPLCFVNSQGVILDVNPAFMRVTGQKEEELIGEPISTFVRKDDVEEMLREAKKSDDIKRKETKIRRIKGKDIPATAFAKARKIRKDVSGVFFSFLDITEIKKKEEEVKKINRRLREKVVEMEKINRLTIGRELKMVKLKERIKELQEELEKYKKEGSQS